MNENEADEGPSRAIREMTKADVIAASGELVGMQVAALCYRRNRQDKTEVLLITSRDTGRWVLPKGWPIKGLTPSEAAAREAFEEAGVEGRVGAEPLGLFSYTKTFAAKEGIPVIVSVFPLAVRRLVEDFPEKGQRQLEWFSPKKAAGKVAEPDLAAILEAFTAPPDP